MPAVLRSPTTWTLTGFREPFRFVHQSMRDHAYAWVLGADASKASGIPLAGEVVQRWLGELHRRATGGGQPLAEWATADNLEIPDFKYELPRGRQSNPARPGVPAHRFPTHGHR
ncbi:hypothetical protein [Nannocystis sp. SCPEA4]|uniref:hypothetical protein n=1 Tax=Nannocystis sp. SCPEA4 TaxID=2996787 RepID=UPI0022701D42|nr:hypothetical protein [Nannocystis sp. SCPEA4]MCY1061165.1 hypothetical protein [Nannocystis sp. SCPEA4]